MTKWIITQQLDRNIHNEIVDVLERSYLDYYSQFFPRLVPISNHPALSIGDEDFDGLLVSGSGELPDRFYTNDHPVIENADLREQKFNIQSKILNTALGRGRKVLAICFGMQLVNVHFGGKVTWDVHQGAPERKPRRNHEIAFQSAARLKHGMQKGNVNSYHNQGIKPEQVAEGFEILALDPEFNVVEAMIHKTYPLLALQWHPERSSPDEKLNQKLIQHFLTQIK